MPAYSHNVQLSHTFAQALMTRIAYTDTKGQSILTPVYDAETERMKLTHLNFGRTRSAYVMANYRRQIVKIWTANLTVQGGYIYNTSDGASGRFVNESGMVYAQLNNTVNITPTLSADITGWYQSRAHFGYYEMSPRGNFSIGLRQQLMKNKMTLSLTVNDIFYTLGEEVRALHDDVNYKLSLRRDSRYVNLTLRYNFGSTTVKAARRKSTGIEDEAGRAR
jgi:hypothetical protein